MDAPALSCVSDYRSLRRLSGKEERAEFADSERNRLGWEGGDCNRRVSNRAAVCARGHRVGKESPRIDSERGGDGCPMRECFQRKKLFVAPYLAELRIDLFSIVEVF